MTRLKMIGVYLQMFYIIAGLLGLILSEELGEIANKL
jgi:hypothetical protein